MSNPQSTPASLAQKVDKICRSTLRSFFCLALGLAIVTTAGCKGCTSTTDEDPPAKEEEEKKKKKLEIELSALTPLFGQELAEEQGAEATPKLLVKPGHWMPTVQRMRANYQDFVLNHSTILVDDNQQPVRIPKTQFTFEISRPVVLAKGREKNIAGEVFVPQGSQATRLLAEFTNRDSGLGQIKQVPKLVRMPSYQYFLQVLAAEPSRYAFLKVTDSVLSEWEEEYDAISEPHYRVALTDAKRELPLPPSAFQWTGVAVLVWDEVDPTKLTDDQQAALLDWLHWGGRLIINGPDSLEVLRGSFLDASLPVDSGGPRSITSDDLRSWSTYWGERESGEIIPPLVPVKPFSGVELTPRENARELAGGGGLFYECNVGRGSVVVSSFQLTQRDFINWGGFDSFLNSALLGRPRRVFSEGPYGGMQIDWQDYPEERLDAHWITGVRMFARDAGAKANMESLEVKDETPFGLSQTTRSLKVDREGGVGAWNTFSPVANTMRNLLLDAAGVEMPKAGFVLMCVGAYLVILVPLNWMVFHALGRVEWAWIAAPVIAIAGTYGVVRMAQLDIGFVRAQTEIALLELQGEHDRGLLSRYTALYSSLSTTYDAEYEIEQSVAIPLAASEEQLNSAIRDQEYAVAFERQKNPALHGLAISSNSTRMVHSEQMIPLEGSVKLGKSSRGDLQVENHSGIDLHNVAIVRQYFPDDGEAAAYQATWIGKFRNGSSEVLGLTGYDFKANPIPYRKERSQSPFASIERLNVDTLLGLAFRFSGAEDSRNARREEYRLVGRIDGLMPGVEVTPAASQVQGATIVVAHLRFGDLPRAHPDANSRKDVKITKATLFDDDFSDETP